MGGGGHDHDHDHGHDHTGHSHGKDAFCADEHKGHDHGEKEDCGVKKECDGHDHDHVDEKPPRRNINVDAAFLHALGDMIMSIGVCISATIIYFGKTKAFWIADPVCTFVFSVIVCFTCTPIIKNCISVLMEGAPADVDSDALIQDIKNLGSDVGVHDFHIWSISVGKYALSAHVSTSNPAEILKKVTDLCKSKYGVDHLAIQVEDTSAGNEHTFDCE